VRNDQLATLKQHPAAGDEGSLASAQPRNRHTQSGARGSTNCERKPISLDRVAEGDGRSRRSHAPRHAPECRSSFDHDGAEPAATLDGWAIRWKMSRDR